MPKEIQSGVFEIKSALVRSFLLVSGQRVLLIDGGFIGGLGAIADTLKHLGLGWDALHTLALTHGHIDHTYNLAALKAKAPQLQIRTHIIESRQVAGNFGYTSTNQLCRLLESCARLALRFRVQRADSTFSDGEEIDFPLRIQALHTPGHTAGHCSFYCEALDLLFAGDLFANWSWRTCRPWPGLNSYPERFKESFRRIDALNPSKILCNHSDGAAPAIQAERYRKWREI